MGEPYRASEQERWAVTAHRLINELAIISGSATILRQGWDGLSDDRRAVLLGQLERHAQAATEVLADLARGNDDLVALPA
jgi:hypothetical protein